MFIVRYLNFIQLTLIFAFVCDGQTAAQSASNNALNEPIVLRLARSTDNKSDTVSQEAENEAAITNKDEPTNQITNKEEYIKNEDNSQTNNNNNKEDSQKSKDEQSSQISNKDETSTVSNARSAESKKETSTTTAKPGGGLPAGLQGWPTGNSKATLILGTFQAIMMPMPDSPIGFPPAAGAG